MQIIEYEGKYLENVRKLLVELEEYLVSIDKDHLDQVGEKYYEKMALIDLDNVKKYDGKCYLAKSDEKIIGLIMGIIPGYEEIDYLDYKCPKKGIVTELIVTKEYQKMGIGNILLEKIENYFKDKGCEYSFIDVFAYNDNAINFYNQKGYHTRMYVDIKKL